MAMVLDVVAFPLFLAALYVLGVGVLRGRGGAETYPLYFYFVAALFTLGVVAVAVNFFTGVASLAYYCIIAALCVAGLTKLRAEDVVSVRRCWLLALLLVPLAAYMAAGSDAGLYHIPHQKLIRDEPIIFGLANLHSRYGFSSLLEYVLAPLWIGERFRLLPYAQAAFIFTWLLFLRQWMWSNHKPIATLGGLTAAGMLAYCMYFDFGYTSTDVPSGIIYAMAFLMGVELLLDGRPVRRCQLTMFFTCTLFAFMCKLSAVVVVAWAGFVVLHLLHQRRLTPRLLLEASVLPTLLLSMWIAKNIIVSGCVLYPDVHSCLNVPWAAKANAIENANGVTGWARQPGASLRPLENWDWLLGWWLPYYASFFLFMLAALVAVAAAYTKWWNTEKYWQHKAMVPSLIFVLAGLALWFFKAPTPRFGIGVFIVLPPILITTLWGFRTSTHAWVPQLRYVLLLALAFRLGVVTNVDVMRGFYRLRLAPELLASPTVSVKEDAHFGVRPTGTIPGADCICWTAHYCAPDNRPPISEFHGYKMFKSL